jgi:hypothetical protein
MTGNSVYLISTEGAPGCDYSTEDAYSCIAPVDKPTMELIV